MQIFIRKITTNRFPVEVEPSDSILTVKQKIKDIEGTLPIAQRLIYKGMVLEEHRTLQDYNIQDEAIVHIVYRRIGG